MFKIFWNSFEMSYYCFFYQPNQPFMYYTFSEKSKVSVSKTKGEQAANPFALSFDLSKTFLLLLAMVSILLFSCRQKEVTPRWVWDEPEGTGRQLYLAFRNDFELNRNEEGMIHLFASSRYKIFVNGNCLGFGPVRSYPESPEYDSWDIKPWLREGKNTIAVLVLNNGMRNFQVPSLKGGFIAWGSVSSGKDITSLVTPGNWKVHRLTGYDPGSPKMTFATGALESYDMRKESVNWLDPLTNTKVWSPVVLLKDQDFFGKLIPRTIPMLTYEELLPKTCLGVYSLKADEDILSFRVKSDDTEENTFNRNKIAFAYTWIHSPRDQTIHAGLWWGDYYVNGKGPLLDYSVDEMKFYRRDYPVHLKKGWNHFFVRYGIVWACWDFYMAVPKSAGLFFSPSRDFSDPFAFMAAGPFQDNEEDTLRKLTVPFAPGELEDFSTGWEPKARNLTAGNPAFETAWSYFDQQIPVLPGKIDSFCLDAGQSTSLVFEMDGKTLGSIFAEYEAPAGTILDICFTEDMKGNRPWVMKRVGLYMGTRHISDGSRVRFETFKPYGAKFLQLTFRPTPGNEGRQVKLYKTGMMSQVYPFQKTGSFECSDPMMNRIWEMGWRTLRVCSEDTYTDTPFRERGLYAGDALPEYAISLATTGDSRLMKRSISVFADMYRDLMIPGSEAPKGSVNHMGDFPLITLQCYAWTVQYTKDIEFAQKYYDGYKNMVERYSSELTANGLFKHNRAFIEWTTIDKNANLTSMQSLIIRSLDTMAEIAMFLKKSDDATRFTALATSGKTVLNDKCWDSEKGAYHDGFRDTLEIPHHFPISSAWPVLFNQVPDGFYAPIASHFSTTLTNIGDVDRKQLTSPYGAFYILGALYLMNMEDLAEEFIRKHWSPMVLKYDDTAWENFMDGGDGTGQGTLSHAWSGHPTYYLSAKALGIDLGYPNPVDHRNLVIAPQTSSLTWARGVVPHPAGLVHVDWKISGDVLFIDYLAPDSLSVKVEPKGKLSRLKLIVNKRNLYN